MSDVLTPTQRSYCMSRIKSRNTKPELALRKTLWGMGYRYRVNYKIIGKPDLVFPGRQIAVFVDGCFWHGCPQHSVKPKTNVQFWEEKLCKNIERDRTVSQELSGAGWHVIRLWEHEIKDDLAGCIEKVTEGFRGDRD